MNNFFGGIRKFKIEKKSSVHNKVPKGKPTEVLNKCLQVLQHVDHDTLNDASLSSSSLSSATTANGGSGIAALQDLVHVTEKSSRQARIELCFAADGKLVPLLLHLLVHHDLCPPQSHAHNLTLVLLNNLSTESENQRHIAWHCQGVKILSQLLCEDPSCYLMAICLVNLSFCAVAVRKEWVQQQKQNKNRQACCQWMQALTFCMRVGSMTREAYHLVQPFLEGEPTATPYRRTPAEYLAILQADCDRQRQRRSSSTSRHGASGRYGSSSHGGSMHKIHQTLPPVHEQLFPDTVRWCVCILKNLTRPHPDVCISDLVFKSGIVPFLCQCITLCHVKSRIAKEDNDDNNDPACLDDAYHVESSSPSRYSVAFNSPEHWVASSTQDAALYVLLNLAANSDNHQRLVDMDALLLLSLVTQFAESHQQQQSGGPQQQQQEAKGPNDYDYYDGGDEHTKNNVPDPVRVMDLQSLKARMALSYILGSQGHFGQKASTLQRVENMAEEKEALLTLTKKDTILLLELLANTLHAREKPGAGGYSAFAMSPKMVLKAIRCLLVEYKNQVLFSEFTGTRLNSLLLKAIALHVFGARPLIDAQAAEDAAVSLYLQSNHGFKHPFLPTVYGVNDPAKGTGARVLAAFARTKSLTAAGKHASRQLVQRVAHVKFGSSDRDTALSSGTFELSDFLLPSELLKLTKLICLPPDLGGRMPTPDFYNRPLFRRRAPRSGELWGVSNVEWFPNALVASQDLIFQSIVKRPDLALDDIDVANTIAQCADGETAEAYNFIWAWQDDYKRIKMFFESNPFHPCSAHRALSSKLLQNTVGSFSGGWATCGRSTVQSS